MDADRDDGNKEYDDDVMCAMPPFPITVQNEIKIIYRFYLDTNNFGFNF